MTIYLLLDKEDNTYKDAYATEDGAKGAKKKLEKKLSAKDGYDVKLKVKKVEVKELVDEAATS